MATNNSANIVTAAAGKVLQGAGIGVNCTFSTPTYPSTSGSSGKVLISDGTNNVYSTPTFPNASATSGKIIKSDGTNWLASTETYAAPGTSGNVMTSDGTNWTSAAAPSGNLNVVKLTLTSAQIKALHATPIEIVAAPGANKIIVPVNCVGKFIYGGTNVFTAAASQTIGVYYNNGTTQVANGSNIISNAMIVGTANKFSASFLLTSNVNQAAGIYDNVNLSLYNSVVTEIGGNAANNNTVIISFAYYVVTMT